jgi:hypothetical protein
LLTIEFAIVRSEDFHVAPDHCSGITVTVRDAVTPADFTGCLTSTAVDIEWTDTSSPSAVGNSRTEPLTLSTTADESTGVRLEPVLMAHTELPAASKRPSFDASLRNTPLTPCGVGRMAASTGELHTAALNTMTGNSNHVA